LNEERRNFPLQKQQANSSFRTVSSIKASEINSNPRLRNITSTYIAVYTLSEESLARKSVKKPLGSLADNVKM